MILRKKIMRKATGIPNTLDLSVELDLYNWEVDVFCDGEAPPLQQAFLLNGEAPRQWT
jgi:hypothetical protein